MPCYHPLRGYRSKTVNPDTNKRSIVFNRNHGFADQEVELKCGQCIGCRLERSRQWAVRCVHEASLYDDNSFITLTYDNAHLPSNNSLDVRDFQLFMKKLRKYFDKKTIRYFHCGEYGEKFQRPHYHACLFNLDFHDKQPHMVRDDVTLYSSNILSKIWGKGHCLIGDVTFESAAYVARYITKKITGQYAKFHYNDIDLSTGEITNERMPEYVTMSRRPGIAKGWFDKFHTDVYSQDFTVINGVKIKPPKYYDSQYELADPEALAKLKASRQENAKRFEDNNTIDRRLVREEIQYEKFSRLKRNYEND